MLPQVVFIQLNDRRHAKCSVLLYNYTGSTRLDVTFWNVNGAVRLTFSSTTSLAKHRASSMPEWGRPIRRTFKRRKALSNPQLPFHRIYFFWSNKEKDEIPFDSDSISQLSQRAAKMYEKYLEFKLKIDPNGHATRTLDPMPNHFQFEIMFQIVAAPRTKCGILLRVTAQISFGKEHQALSGGYIVEPLQEVAVHR